MAARRTPHAYLFSVDTRRMSAATPHPTTTSPYTNERLNTDFGLQNNSPAIMAGPSRESLQMFTSMLPPHSLYTAEAPDCFWQPGIQAMTFWHCKRFLEIGLQSGDLRHVDALSHVLGIAQSPYFTAECESFLCYNDQMHAHIIPIDTEWYESNPRQVTELGIAGVSVYNARFGFSSKFTDVLATMEVNHLRIKENAHKVNGRRCQGHPEDFGFGATGFVTEEEGRGVLHTSLMQWNNEYLRPIILVGHAVDNDAHEFRDHLGINLDDYPILMTLDT